MRAVRKSGYDAHVSILHRHQNPTVLKKYRRRAPALDWLRAVLREPYGDCGEVDLVALHEYEVLRYLQPFGIVPRVRGLGLRSISMDFAGNPIDRNAGSLDDSLEEEGRRIWSALQEAGVAHNDIRDCNILQMDGRVTLVDFTMADCPWFSVSSRHPDPSWGRFEMDNRLLNLSGGPLD
jgi:RIO-like serine/threonine protein kinase